MAWARRRSVTPDRHSALPARRSTRDFGRTRSSSSSAFLCLCPPPRMLVMHSAPVSFRWRLSLNPRSARCVRASRLRDDALPVGLRVSPRQPPAGARAPARPRHSRTQGRGGARAVRTAERAGPQPRLPLEHLGDRAGEAAGRRADHHDRHDGRHVHRRFADRRNTGGSLAREHAAASIDRRRGRCWRSLLLRLMVFPSWSMCCFLR